MGEVRLMTALTPDLKPFVVTEDDFYELCRANPDLRLERTASGEVIIMPPTLITRPLLRPPAQHSPPAIHVILVRFPAYP